MHPDQAQNTSSGIQGQEATAVAVIYVTDLGSLNSVVAVFSGGVIFALNFGNLQFL